MLAEVEIEVADGSSVTEVASFFVDSFWTSSTTFGAVALSTRECGQLALQMDDDFRHRYSNSWQRGGEGKRRRGRRFFPSRLLLARDPDPEANGAVVGCVGVEAALMCPYTRTVFPAAEAEARRHHPRLLLRHHLRLDRNLLLLQLLLLSRPPPRRCSRRSSS